MVVTFDPKDCLPSFAELPDSDDTPVGNELQNLIPNLLDAILAIAWAFRQDWLFGVDMSIYDDPSRSAAVPDGFLSLGVERFIGEEGRLSYVFWKEDNIPPILALEVVSKPIRTKKRNLCGFRDSLLCRVSPESKYAPQALTP